MEKLKEKQNRKKEKKQNGTKEQPAVQQTPKATPITEGCPVRIKGQSSVGEVLEINGKECRGSLRQPQDNCKDGAAGTAATQSPKTRVCQKFFCQQPDSGQHVRKKLNFKQDIDVRGMRGDEALQAVTYFVDDAILVGMSRVRILHGTGTGILRTLIRQYLQTIPGVRHLPTNISNWEVQVSR